MEKIEILLEKLDNRITASLAKRLDAFDDLNEKLDVVGQEYEKDPSDSNREKYNEIIEYVEEKELGIITDLEALLSKRKSDELAKKSEDTPPTPNPTPATPTSTEKVDSEVKKEGSGVLTLVIGSVLLVASLGAINYFRKQ